MTPFGDLEVGAVAPPCPDAPSQQPVYWVEIELVGEDDQPIPFEEYKLILPDGSPADGHLDEDGFARHGGILKAGDCKISFPNLDKDAWESVGTLPMRAPRTAA